MATYKEHSKTLWRRGDNPDKYPGDSKLAIGCLQRISDSLERIEQPYKQLLADRERYERWYNEEKVKRHKLEKQIAAYRGVINRMKKLKS